MEATATDLRSISPLTRKDAVELGRVEYRRFADAISRLDPADFSTPTDCDGWTVRHLVAHLAGAMTTATSLRALLREQSEVAKRRKTTGEAEIDAMTAVQIARVAELRDDELVALVSSLVDRAANGRKRVPSVVAKLVQFNVEMPGISERWRLDYMLGTILTRDTWLHRVSDLARAVGTPPVTDGGHDGRIVADVAAEWARRHGQPVELTLSGPAGGVFVSGSDGPRIELDAIEFCRTLSGRAAPTHPLLATPVPF